MHEKFSYLLITDAKNVSIVLQKSNILHCMKLVNMVRTQKNTCMEDLETPTMSYTVNLELFKSRESNPIRSIDL